MAGPRMFYNLGSYEDYLRRSCEFNRRAAAQRETPQDLWELLRLDRDEIIYLPGPKATTNAIGIPLIRAALKEEE